MYIIIYDIVRAQIVYNNNIIIIHDIGTVYAPGGQKCQSQTRLDCKYILISADQPSLVGHYNTITCSTHIYTRRVYIILMRGMMAPKRKRTNTLRHTQHIIYVPTY